MVSTTFWRACLITWTGVAFWAVFAADAVAQGSAASDRAALEAIYRSTDGDNWTNNTNWLSNAPLEDYYGVEVTDGRVTGLRLGGWDETARRHVGNRLTGSLPAELGTLSELRWVRIGGNSGLTGRIPAELGNLTRLEYVNLQANWLTGSIPAALGHLTELEFILLDDNALTGSTPAELGNLRKLRVLGLSHTMLSGPLPESLISLSALESLNLDGSGLCVPDTSVMQAWVATISDFTGAVCDDGSVSFLRVLTQPGLGELDHVFAVADFSGDGLDDILAGDIVDHRPDFRPEDRLTKVPLYLFVSVGDGSFRHAPELVDGTIEAHAAVAVVDDFNGDSRPDLAVFDHGAYVDEESLGYGNPPQLFLSGSDGRLRSSDALADAVRLEHERQKPPLGAPFASGPSDLHLKTATAGDIDNDSDLDLWVESAGGANVTNHFMVNNGDGTFTVELARASDAVLRNRPQSGRRWRYHEGQLLDVDHDGDLDLVAGQIRDADRDDQFSVVLMNDGTGYYPRRVELPHPAFNDGYTRVFGIVDFDVNADSATDLLMLHTRNGIAGGWSGRHIQTLIGVTEGTAFVDGTSAWIGDQSAAELAAYSLGKLEMHDVDRDGCSDLIVVGSRGDIRVESPIAYRNDGNSRFRAMSPESFAGSDHYFGRHAVPAEINGDAAIDFVVPHHDDGPDDQHGTADDFTTLVTLLNTTPPGPARCGGRANRPPALAGTLPDRTVVLDGTVNLDVSRAFADPDGDALTYTVSSSAPRVVTASAAGAVVTLTALLGEGTAAIRVTATDPGGLSATQSFTVTVSATTVSVPFTDNPLQPGVTPVKAVHFTELRTRIDALRGTADLLRFSWTDPVLRAGVTRVRSVHLLELRAALAEAYEAAGRAAPRWTDASPAAGSTPIRSAHVTELRAAVLALE